jgi:hypothetical protein
MYGLPEAEGLKVPGGDEANGLVGGEKPPALAGLLKGDGLLKGAPCKPPLVAGEVLQGLGTPGVVE